MPYLLMYRAAEDALRTPSAYFLIALTSSRVMPYFTVHCLPESSWQESPSYTGHSLNTILPVWSCVEPTRLRISLSVSEYCGTQEGGTEGEAR